MRGWGSAGMGGSSMAWGSSSRGAGVCRHQSHRDNSCCAGEKDQWCPQGHLLLLSAFHGTDVQNKLFPSLEEGLLPASWYPAEGGTVYPVGQAQGAVDTFQKGWMLWQGWCSDLAACTGRV